MVCKTVSSVTDWLGEDVEMATRTRAPVLITAPPGRALAIAQDIAGRSGLAGSVALVLCDALAGYDLAAAVTGTSVENGCDEPPTMVLREVQMLSKSEQEALMKALDSRPSQSNDQMPRIITTASVPLVDRVRQGAFDERLFYRLNIMHIVVPPEGGDS